MCSCRRNTASWVPCKGKANNHSTIQNSAVYVWSSHSRSFSWNRIQSGMESYWSHIAMPAEWGEVYCTNYQPSWHLQLQRTKSVLDFSANS